MENSNSSYSPISLTILGIFHTPYRECMRTTGRVSPRLIGNFIIQRSSSLILVISITACRWVRPIASGTLTGIQSCIVAIITTVGTPLTTCQRPISIVRTVIAIFKYRSCALFHKFTFLFYLIQYARRYNPVTFRTRIINRFMTVRRIEISARFIRVTPEVIFTISTCTGPCAQIPVGFCILYIICLLYTSDAADD